MGGEVLRGWIEYYDRRMVRLTRDGAPNLFIFKHEIAYIAEEAPAKPRTEKIVESRRFPSAANEPIPPETWNRLRAKPARC